MYFTLRIFKKIHHSSFSGGNYAGLDLKRHIEEQSLDSPLSSTENQDSLQEPEVKRPRQDQHYETE